MTTLIIMAHESSSINPCPNCETTRSATDRKCGTCGYRFDVDDAAVVVATEPRAKGEHSSAAAPARWRDSRSAQYVKGVGLVVLGIVIGAIVAAPSEDQVASAKSAATKIEQAAAQERSKARTATADAKRKVEEAEEERHTLAKGNAYLRLTNNGLAHRKSALIDQATSLNDALSSKRDELKDLRADIASAREQAAAARRAANAAPASSSGSSGGCNPNYSGACLKQGAGDYDCAGGSGDGPNYTGTVSVVGYDEFDLDRDGDGIACDT
jgi:hypothetical protein